MYQYKEGLESPKYQRLFIIRSNTIKTYPDPNPKHFWDGQRLEIV
ncbi:uncharacterized protein METZ01_LOCUS479027 [marine metagenome]|uniref:Uncharacterized protein n=1 Tax=marine metagenome TaxID=408172 RepID=A0A383C276_9ZZZZ